MNRPGILSAGAYAPGNRVPAAAFDEAWGRFKSTGIEEKAVTEPDEDSVTMAYEAGRRAIDSGAYTPTDIDRLAFATTTPPTAEEDPSIQLAEMFGLDEDTKLQLYTGSTRAGTQALLRTLEESDSDDLGLVIASDCPRGKPETEIEHAAGAGAAAFVIGPTPNATVSEYTEVSALAQGTRYRRGGDDTVESLDITSYEREVFVDTVASAVDSLDVDPSVTDAAVVQSPNGRLPYRVGSALGIDASKIKPYTPVHELGDLGAASVPMGLLEALADGNTVLAASFGSGAGSDGVVIEPDSAVPTRVDIESTNELSYPEYLQRRGELTSGPPAGGGAYVSVPAWRRTIPQRYRLVAGECPHCESLNFPPTGSCSTCHDIVSYERIQLSRTGTVEAVTVISQGGAPPEFAEQQARGGDFAVSIVALDGPDDRTASIPAQVIDVDPSSVEVGDRVETTIRRIYTQEGVTRYGFKVRQV